MRIVVSSIYVDDQDKALRFYTTQLGFVKKTKIPLGAARWLTMVAPDDLDGTELLLEPDTHPAAGPFKSDSPMATIGSARSGRRCFATSQRATRRGAW